RTTAAATKTAATTAAATPDPVMAARPRIKSSVRCRTPLVAVIVEGAESCRPLPGAAPRLAAFNSGALLRSRNVAGARRRHAVGAPVRNPAAPLDARRTGDRWAKGLPTNVA